MATNISKEHTLLIMKSTLMTFLTESIVHQELVHLGLMVNQHYYLEDLPQLRKQVWQKHLNDGLTRTGWNNSLAHTALLLHKFLAIENMVVFSHPPDSPDMVSWGLIFCSAWNDSFKGVFRMSLKFKHNYWQFYMSYENVNSTGASMHMLIYIAWMTLSHIQ